MIQCLTTWLEACERDKESKVEINSLTQRPSFTSQTLFPLSTTTEPSTSQLLRIQKLSVEEMMTDC